MEPDRKIPFSRTLAFRFSLFFLTGILVIFSVAFYLTFDYAYSILLKDAEEDARNTTMLTISRIENILQPVEQIPLTLASALDVDDPNYKDVMNITRDVLLENKLIYASCLAFEPYRYNPSRYWYGAYQYETRYGIRTRVLGNSDYDYFQYDWYRLPKTLKRPVWTEPYFDKGGGDTLMCTYSVPFYSMHEGVRSFSGVLTLDLSLHSLAELVNNVRVYQSGFGFLVSAKGQILTFPLDSLVNRSLLDLIMKTGHDQSVDAVKSMLRGETDFVRFHSFDGKGKQRLLYYAPVASTGWSFALVFPVEELFADLIAFLWRLIGIFAVSVLAILTLTLLVIRQFTRPVSRLVEATHRIGHGDFNLTLPAVRSGGEIALLSDAFSRMQKELTGYIEHLQRTTIAKEKMESELQIAHKIQMGMLPVRFPEIPGWDLAAHLASARAVGGDFYDFFFPDKNHLCFAIGDVSGKGVPAALFMMVTRTLLRSRIQPDIPLGRIISGINRDLCEENQNQMFVTFFAGLIDLHTGRIQCCNAGHNPPYRVNGPDVNTITGLPVAIPLGVVPDYSYDTSQILLERGVSLALYTDGVTDAENPAGELMGAQKLVSVLAECPKGSSGEIVTAISGAVTSFSMGAEQSDDITILVLTNNGNTMNHTDHMRTSELLLWNQLGELERITAWLEQTTGEWNLPPKIMMEINLVIEELFTNIVFYAFDDDLDHQIHLALSQPDDHTLTIVLADDGKPFNLLEKDSDSEVGKDIQERKIGGLGIHFVKQLMSSVEYRREKDKNVVILTRIY